MRKSEHPRIRCRDIKGLDWACPDLTNISRGGHDGSEGGDVVIEVS